MDRPKPQPTVLTFTTPAGHVLAEAVSIHARGVADDGNWPILDARTDDMPTWCLRLGPALYEHQRTSLLPRELWDELLPLEAKTPEEAMEALDRAGCALEAHMANHLTAMAHLLNRVTDAQAYGKAPELPLNEGPL